MNKKNKSNLFEFVLLGVLIGLSLLFEWTSFYLVIPTTGFNLEIHYIIYIIGICCFYHKRYSFAFIFLTPLIWLLTPNEYIINIWQLLTEYVLTAYIFSFLLLNNSFIFNNKLENSRFCLFLLTLFICFLIKLFIHVVSGVVWWHANWIGSLILNAQTIGFNWIVCFIVILLSVKPVIKIKTKFFNPNNNY